MRYDVHIFAIVRVKIPNVNAESPTDAISKAERNIDLYRLFDSRNQESHVSESEASQTEYADGLDKQLAYLVDQVGDIGFTHSRRFDANREPIDTQ